MQTKQIYYEKPYLKELEVKVLSSEKKGNLTNIILDQTIFFPQGGGQPSDRGKLKSPKWLAKIKFVRVIDGEVVHQAKTNGELDNNNQIKAEIDWNWRYKYMKIHSAGHLLHDVLMQITEALIPIKGSHGKKAYLEYKGNINTNIKNDLEKKVNETAKQNLEIITKEVTYQELENKAKFLPPNLPKDKTLRMIKIGNFPAMPDGGIHLKNTKELGKIYIPHIKSENGKTKIRYGVVLT